MQTPFFKKTRTLMQAGWPILLMPLLLTGCGGGAWTAPPPIVESMPVTQADWMVHYSTSGTLEANNKVDLNSEMSGIVSQVVVTEGQAVSKGQVLIRLKADKQVAQVQQSAAGVEASKSTLQQVSADIQAAEARLESALVRKSLAQNELQRFENLFKDQFVSQFELDQKRNNYDVALSAYNEARQQVAAAKARKAQSESSLAQARSSYQYSRALASESVIRAPFSGVVGQRFVDPGDYVSPSQRMLTVVDPSRFKLQFSVPERLVGRLQTNQQVSARFEALDNQAFAGTVYFVDPVVDPGSHTVLVKAYLPGKAPLRHGMFAVVDLNLGMIRDALIVPEEAIVPQGEKTFVYIVKDRPDSVSDSQAQTAPAEADVKYVYLQEVTVGHREAGKAQISSGLTAGESVLISGLQKVMDGMAVRLKAPPSAKSSPSKQ